MENYKEEKLNNVSDDLDKQDDKQVEDEKLEKDDNLDEKNEDQKKDDENSEIPKEVDSDLNQVSPQAVQQITYLFNYSLDSNNNQNCNISNELILDNTTLYESDSNDIKINSQNANISLNNEGSLSILSASKNPIVLSMKLVSSETPLPASNNQWENCIDTPYGFKLSQVLNNLGDMTTITPNDPRIPNVEGQLSITQRAFIINNKNINRREILINFYIKNIGTDKARRVLFKDILPNGVVLKLGGIYINSCQANSGDINLNSQTLIVKLPDLSVGESIVLSILCSECDDICNDSNIGVVSYVSKFSVTSPQSQYSISLKQDISNSKSMDNTIKNS